MFQLTIPLPNHPGDKLEWGNLSQAGPAFVIASAAQADNHPLMIITPDSASANRLEEELAFFLAGNESVKLQQMPDWEILPYDTFSPHQDIISQRLSTLYQLPTSGSSSIKTILIVSISTLLNRLCPKSFLLGSCLSLQPGTRFIIDDRRNQFEQAGYRCVDSVMEHGEFAIRGSIVDIFPMGADIPYRIDLFDDEIESLRTFDPETQRSVTKVPEIQLLPGHEFPMDKQGQERFRSNFRETFDVNHRDCPLYQDIGEGIVSPGIEYYLPLFFKETATLFDYLPENTRVLVYDTVNAALDHYYADVKARYENRRVDPLRPILPPSQVLMPPEELYSRLNDFPRVTLFDQPVPTKAGRFNLSRADLPELTINARLEQPLSHLRSFIDDVSNVLLVAESPGRREVLLELLAQNDIFPELCDNWSTFVTDKITEKPTLAISIGLLENGLYLPDNHLVIIPEALLLGQRVQQTRRRKSGEEQSADQVIRNLTELRMGAPVVHIDHGVGRYRGLETLAVDGQTTEFLSLEYANEAKLYVPVASLHLISRYTGADDDLAPLHRLGSEQWSKVRRKAAEKARDVAVELLDIYARREARKGFPFEKPEQNYLAFAAAFPFEETPDQQQTIASVIRDMCAPKPMDRLVCGDVGFGKTEVAMRAAFLAVQSGKQVAILVPTTLLAQQHYESFRDRFADWPVEIEVISRFKSQKAIDHIKERLPEGKLDIIIGTHKILQGDLNFKDLGLLIIDEEHRFGVRHKEKLKSLRSEVDILTLTATPIPRTLNMAMSGIRDLSIIATPPARRLSVKTFVRQYDQPLVKEAILRELLRGGQVYYLHNQVETIEKTASDLQELIPEARVITGHGQMRERQLEQVMSDFYHKRYNVLVCTTIIETGIDIPNANTIIINRADKFGLAQLHQLRGRVGRSHHQAYAYLLTPSPKAMTADAVKRLEAITDAQTLGAGFMLASNDLEIRGAGELLGEGQSGQIQSVGFTLYTEMLERAVSSIRNGETPNPDQPLNHGTEVNLRLPALLPEDYIHDAHNRLILYKRIAAATNEEGLKNLQVELIDRFGLLPDPAKHLFRQMKLKLHAQELGIKKLDAGSKQARIEFEEQPSVDPMVIINLIQSSPQQFRLEGSSILKYIDTMETPEQRFTATEALLSRLAR
ncbi:transcription-repair coupling factor [Endozoicomonas elysicola]|uniref:Transcription-repair-coupling factor n=1 Tax=Endozoicomonas elysicola TaxID=305900 RepID=A0A081KCF0_9GAMM|nr:transcription-repair coupling factor [Endozoicomonas elysicola]KEI71826.1 transcription-repair coupling factor [Endozoicomonas elysicola]